MTLAIHALSRWAIPLMLLGITAWGLSNKVPIYERFVEGAKDGWQTAVRLLPYLVGMLVAIQVFQHTGALQHLIRLLAPLTGRSVSRGSALVLVAPSRLRVAGAVGPSLSYGPDSWSDVWRRTGQYGTSLYAYCLCWLGS